MKTWSSLLLLTLLFSVGSASAQVPADKALATLNVVEGLQVELFASEPLFTNPTCMDIDAHGRVWICESVNYRYQLRKTKPNRPEGDRIVVLEDGDGDGKADRATTFYQALELLAPLGIAIAPHANGPGATVYVCQSPDILVFEDTDGDLKADGNPRKLLSGFRGVDHDHGVHSILIGPDRKLYFTVGDSGMVDLTSSDGKGRSWRSNSTDCRAGTVWRCDLDGKNLELVAHNFRNNYEVCVDSFGTMFLSDNDDDGNQQTRICYVMPGGNYGYHPRGPGQSHWHEEQPGVVPKILRTYFGSPTGICLYEGTLLPEKYRGQILHTDAGPRHLRCYHVKPQGGGYDVEREDLIESKDNWFRPSDVCVAPDGSVFVADWYDPGVGGHGMGDITRGRVYRVIPRGHKGYKLPVVNLESDAGLLTALRSANLAVRAQAMAKLQTLDRKEAITLLKSVASQRHDPVLQARARWQLAVLGSPGPVGANLAEKDPNVRIQALRIYKDFERATPAQLCSTLKEHILKDPSDAVRREALLLLRDVDGNAAREVLHGLMKTYKGNDRIFLAAIGIAVGTERPRRDELLADFAVRYPTWNEAVADLVWELRPTAAMPLLEARLLDARLSATQRARVIDILATSEDSKAGSSLLRVLAGEIPEEVRTRILENLKLFLPTKWKDLRQSAELTTSIDRLLSTPATAPTGLALIAAAERVDQVGRVGNLLLRQESGVGVQQAAIKALGALPSAEAVAQLVRLLPRVPAESLGVTIVQALGQPLDGHLRQNPASQPATTALHGLVQGDGPLLLRQAAVNTLAGSRSGTEWLLDLNGKGKLPESLRADAARSLRNTPYQDLRNRALVAFPPPGRLDPRKLPSVSALALRRGDAARGKQLLAASAKSDSQCLKCHAVRGTGGNIGPDLSMIGKKASRDNLIESILQPSKAIADQYISWILETKQGLTLTGLLVEETGDTVTLRDANGKDIRIDKKSIDTRVKGPNSLMPADLLVYLSEENLVDMVEYLLTLKTPTYTPDLWHIAGPFENGPDRAGLNREFAPEKGINLKAEYAGKTGRIPWRTVRPTAQNYVDLQAMHGIDSKQSLSYLYHEFDSPSEQDATLMLGTDDGARVWLNGKEVFHTRATRAAFPEQDSVRVRLRKGRNAVLVKIDNGDGPHGLYFSVASEEELGKEPRSGPPK